jgi:hypothetical protein
MPRSNHQRGRRAAKASDESENDIDLSRALRSRTRTESVRGGLWNVQDIAAASSTKSYTCPGCRLVIDPGVAHTVAWRADGLMGAADDLAGRRHWHHHCWKIR